MRSSWCNLEFLHRLLSCQYNAHSVEYDVVTFIQSADIQSITFGTFYYTNTSSSEDCILSEASLWLPKNFLPVIARFPLHEWQKVQLFHTSLIHVTRACHLTPQLPCKLAIQPILLHCRDCTSTLAVTCTILQPHLLA